MAKLKILNPSGHNEHEWEVDTESQTLAQQLFEKALNTDGYVAIAIMPDDTKEIVREFVPDAKEIFMFPQISGG
jgi:hypothetical protein